MTKMPAPKGGRRRSDFRGGYQYATIPEDLDLLAPRTKIGAPSKQERHLRQVAAILKAKLDTLEPPNPTEQFIRGFLRHLQQDGHTQPVVGRGGWRGQPGVPKEYIRTTHYALALHPSKYGDVAHLDFGPEVELVSDLSVGLEEVRATVRT